MWRLLGFYYSMKVFPLFDLSERLTCYGLTDTSDNLELMETNPYKIIATRRHAKLAEKEEVYKLIADTYAGGNRYIKGNHLHQYIKEGSIEFKQRAKRSYMFNFLQPIADTLSGFIFANEPERKIPEKISYILEKASKDKSLTDFMQTIAIHSQQYPVAVLVDAPKFDIDEIRTEADRKEKVGNPYCVLYFPWQIRDFYLDDEGCLEWIILDNCEIEKDNPMIEAMEKKRYTLWTKTDYLSVIESNTNNKSEWILEEQFTHNLGKCPVILHNFRDANEDGISETPFENTAILTRVIYNWLSCFDEMIHSGSFKMLFVGIEKESDIPKELITGGVGSLTVFPYNGKFSAPVFSGAGLEDVTPVVTAIDMVIKQIYSTFGLDKDTDKMYVQSGMAKAKEFEKCEAFLRGGAYSLEALEENIMEILCLREGIPNDSEIHYSKSFNDEEVGNVLTRLYQSMMLPFKSIQDMATKEIVKKTFNHLDDSTLTELIKTIESEKPTQITNAKIQNEAKARKNNDDLTASNNGNTEKENDD